MRNTQQEIDLIGEKFSPIGIISTLFEFLGARLALPPEATIINVSFHVNTSVT